MKNLYIILLFTFGFGQDYSLSFDGVDDYVNIGNPEILNGNTFNGLISIECWVKINELGSQQRLVSKADDIEHDDSYKLLILPDGRVSGTVYPHTWGVESVSVSGIISICFQYHI